MGYYTYHHVEIIGDTSPSYREDGEIYQALLEQSEHYTFHEVCKWRNLEEDCLTISKRYPHCFILVEGDGDESPDFWKCIFHNGQMFFSEGKLIYPDWDDHPLVKQANFVEQLE